LLYFSVSHFVYECVGGLPMHEFRLQFEKGQVRRLSQTFWIVVTRQTAEACLSVAPCRHLLAGCLHIGLSESWRYSSKLLCWPSAHSPCVTASRCVAFTKKYHSWPVAASKWQQTTDRDADPSERGGLTPSALVPMLTQSRIFRFFTPACSGCNYRRVGSTPRQTISIYRRGRVFRYIAAVNYFDMSPQQTISIYRLGKLFRYIATSPAARRADTLRPLLWRSSAHSVSCPFPSLISACLGFILSSMGHISTQIL
jgi:hypothetical protein